VDHEETVEPEKFDQRRAFVGIQSGAEVHLGCHQRSEIFEPEGIARGGRGPGRGLCARVPRGAGARWVYQVGSKGKKTKYRWTRIKIPICTEPPYTRPAMPVPPWCWAERSLRCPLSPTR